MAFIASLFLFTLSACQKENSIQDLSPEEEETAVEASSESEAEAESTGNDVFEDALGASDEVGMSGTVMFGARLSGSSGIDSLPGCATITVTRLNAPAPFPVRIVTDFRTAGCLGRDGKTRYGKIITLYTGRLIEPGKSSTTTFDGYRVDSTSVQGIYRITNTSSAGSRQFTVVVENGKKSWPSGNYIHWNSERVYTQVEGLSTPYLPLDDVFTVTGSTRGSVKRGDRINLWESKIIEPLRKKFTCRWISKGVVRTVRSNASTTTPWVAILNYGNGDCDNQATLKINGRTKTITLR